MPNRVTVRFDCEGGDELYHSLKKMSKLSGVSINRIILDAVRGKIKGCDDDFREQVLTRLDNLEKVSKGT